MIVIRDLNHSQVIIPQRSLSEFARSLALSLSLDESSLNAEDDGRHLLTLYTGSKTVQLVV
jgi:hypothetical protein